MTRYKGKLYTRVEELGKVVGKETECVVMDCVREGAFNWAGYWDGVDVLVAQGGITDILHVNDMAAWSNGYGGTEVTGAHQSTKAQVVQALEELGCTVIED